MRQYIVLRYNRRQHCILSTGKQVLKFLLEFSSTLFVIQYFNLKLFLKTVTCIRSDLLENISDGNKLVSKDVFLHIINIIILQQISYNF